MSDIAPPAPEQTAESQGDLSIGQRLMLSAETPAAAAGGILGGAIGAPMGPIGIAGGSALGAAAGVAVAENIRDIARAFGVQEMGASPNLSQRFENVAEEAVFDLAFTSAAPVISSVLRGGKRALASMFGVGPEGLAAAEQARRLGIDLSIMDVTRAKTPDFFSKVFGRFPLLGGPLREAAQRKGGQMLAAKERLFLRLGPSMSMARLGVDLNQAATDTFKAFRKHINGLYDDARRLAIARNATIPTQGVKRTASEVLDQIVSRRGRLPDDSPVVKLIREEIDQLPEQISLERFDGLVDQIDRMANTGRREALDIHGLGNLKSSTEEALQQISDPEVLKAFQRADKTFAKAMAEVFETPTAQRFARVDKERFNVRKITRQGTRNPDELFSIAFNTKSADAMRDLRKLVGDEAFERSVRGHLDTVFQRALESGEEALRAGRGTTNAGIDLDVLKRGFGLDDPRSPQFAAMSEALSGTGLPMETLQKFVGAVEDAVRIVPPDVNTFIARRGTLGGVRSIINALLPGAAVSSAAAGAPSLSAAFGAMMLARGFGSFLANPKWVRLGSRILNEGLSMQARQQAARALSEIMFPREERSVIPEVNF